MRSLAGGPETEIPVKSRAVEGQRRVQQCVILAAKLGGHKHLLPHWLTHLGVLGVFVVAVIDSSVIPLPLPGSTDLLILLLTAHRGNPWFLALAAISGSVIGGYLTWSAGKRGGEGMLERHVPKRFLTRIRGWVERRGVLTVVLASILPPPIPLLPFLLSAGALGVGRRPFLVSFTVGRTVRYGLIVWLGATYGRRVIRAWSQYMAGWSDVILWAFIGLLTMAVLFGVWKYRRDKRRSQSPAPAQATG